MRSTTGEHWIALDHVRALAAFLVFSWHFLHWSDGTPVAYAGAPVVFVLAPFDEGHTGVALFMALSGYIFAKLLDGRRIMVGWFLWNRMLRLAPLLLVTMALAGLNIAAHHGDYVAYLKSLPLGLVLPSWPNGGWSIAVELHFYVLLPLMLVVMRRNPALLALTLLISISARIGLFMQLGEVKSAAYFTIIGRYDDFALGMLAFQYRRYLKRRHRLALAVLISYCAFYWAFDWFGGANGLTRSWIWIILPTIEAACFASLIGYYDQSTSFQDRGISWLVARAGAYSYSIYLMHLFVVNHMTHLIERYVNLSNFYVALFWAIPAFFAMLPLGYLSFRFIEAPPLAYRRRYAITDPTLGKPATAALGQEASEAL
ncbi:acyltransferase family protein [Sphingomonas oligophenolica]|uniref:Acyltransferase n=1 Tax=Sphingomonas oligophenolica TaxID=301154 RepID=A0A502C5Z0_9SPHN|nr:acyltransferase [Sphingomonas oligophenolica]TPG08120.1 acyltransferase [Sphingomonas oligophenolica]